MPTFHPSRKNHWENIYQTKAMKDVSWYQAIPETSLDFIQKNTPNRSAKIIDVGGGDSLLVDHLLDLGYVDLTVLDISETAIKKAQKRLGTHANEVKWINTDISDFNSIERYDLWHDRATFHFLTEDRAIAHYIEIAQKSLCPNGVLILGTFSERGPKKCSGIDIKPYSENSLTALFQAYFEKIECISIDHNTPFDTVQNFTFCSFRRK